MSSSVSLAALWVVAAALVAMLPYRAQFAPGVVLLLAAPALIAWMGLQHGALAVAVGLFGFVSMFRRPLGHLARRAAARLRGRGPGDAA